MIKYYLLFILLGLNLPRSFTQANHDHTWLHGYTSDQPWPEFFWGTKFDFNEEPMSYSFYEKKAGFGFSATSLSDSLGKLLFYTNGCELFDANHELIENSFPLAPSRMHDFFCDEPMESAFGHFRGYGTSQAVCAVPNLRQEGSFLVLLGLFNFNVPGIWAIMGSIVVSEAVREGDKLVVTEKNVELISGDLTVNVITMVKHSNNLDWWILTFDAVTNRYHSILLEGNQLAYVESDTLGMAFTRTQDGWGQVNISPDGKKVVRHSPSGGTMLYDFDRTTGRLSNFEFFHLGDDPVYSNSFGGAAFSPDNKLLYVASVTQLFQVDLSAEDKAASAILIDEWDGTRYLGSWEVAFYQMQNAPDCKIYNIGLGNTPYMHVIHHPNIRGKDCNFEQRAIEADNSFYATHLNYPNYRLGTEWENWCDTLTVGAFEMDNSTNHFTIFPNPAQDEFFISYKGSSEILHVRIELINTQGQTIYHTKREIQGGQASIQVSSIPAGSYLLRVSSEVSDPFVSKVIIVR